MTLLISIIMAPGLRPRPTLYFKRQMVVTIVLQKLGSDHWPATFLHHGGDS